MKLPITDLKILEEFKTKDEILNSKYLKSADRKSVEAFLKKMINPANLIIVGYNDGNDCERNEMWGLFGYPDKNILGIQMLIKMYLKKHNLIETGILRANTCIELDSEEVEEYAPEVDLELFDEMVDQVMSAFGIVIYKIGESFNPYEQKRLIDSPKSYHRGKNKILFSMVVKCDINTDNDYWKL